MSSVWDRLEPHLLAVQSPSQYIGGEWNSIRKEKAEVQVALAFPDVYRIGMSHLGLQILYGMINARPDALAERIFAPWPDLEERLRREGIPLFSVDSHRPAREFDILGFSLQTELGYTNVLNMLELAGIPLLARERGPEFPLIVGGGVNASYPEPLAEFFDLFIIGDGEAAVPALIDLVREFGKDRDGLLRAAPERIPGAYVPSRYVWRFGPDGKIISWTGPTVKKAHVESLAEAYTPLRPLVPYAEVVHDRINLEIMRGCPHRCRFCHAVSLKNRLRIRTVDQLVRQAEEIYRATGYDEIALTSLSSGDYPHLQELMARLNARFRRLRVSLSLPSLRVDGKLAELPSLMTTVRKGGFTLAPEGGTEALRRILNKPLRDEDLLAGVRAAFQAGWTHVKLYFMIGFPMETDRDLEGIVETARRVSEEGRRVRGQAADVNVTVSPLVPKPHTPFQFCGQRGREELREKMRRLASLARGSRIRLKGHDPDRSLIEAVLARGDRRLSSVLQAAHRLGARFDEWSEHFDFSRWRRAFEAAGIDPEAAAQRSFTVEDLLPWEAVDVGRPKESLWSEYQAALQAARDPEAHRAEKTG